MSSVFMNIKNKTKLVDTIVACSIICKKKKNFIDYIIVNDFWKQEYSFNQT
jgi:hypothetical protein